MTRPTEDAPLPLLLLLLLLLLLIASAWSRFVAMKRQPCSRMRAVAYTSLLQGAGATNTTVPAAETTAVKVL
jgi:hypothetical protein